jgi:putative heme-binding domain-containing protein
VEHGAIDLAARPAQDSRQLAWQTIQGTSGLALPAFPDARQHASSYVYFRLQSLQSQPAVLTVPVTRKTRLWHNGRAVEGGTPFVLSLDAGSNDILLRVEQGERDAAAELSVQAGQPLAMSLPENPGPGGLTERLKQAAAGASDSAVAEFLKVDWNTAPQTGNADRGRRLFAADGLGCAKCHAIGASQKGGGAPSLAGAVRRFTVGQIVESILLPNRQVAPVFGTTSISTVDGQALSGLVVEENEREIVLLLPTAARQTVRKSDIEARKLQPTSPMPGGLVKTPDELRDLLAYLLRPNPSPP